MSTWSYMSTKGQGQSWTLVQISDSIFLNFISSITIRQMWSLLGMGDRKLVQMVQVTWLRWPPCPYMVKTFKISSSLEPKGKCHWNLVCSIEYSRTTKYVQIMPLVWPWLFYGKIKFGPLCFSMEKVKTFSSGELIGWDSSRRPCVRPCIHTFKHEYLWDLLADCNQILYEASLG